MALNTEERRQELRQKLIDAAERTITTRGLSALRARDLAAEVGCALGAIYNVFPDLDALIFEANARTLTAFERFFERLAQTEIPDAEAAVTHLRLLARGYLEFAMKHRLRWRALFDHRMEEGHQIPGWFLEQQKSLFLLVERPLAVLRPDLDPDERATFARSVFAAIHGVVSLGLDEKLMPMRPAVLRAQVGEIFATLGAGLAARPGEAAAS
jgi:AcrR family transcriptional regulator